MSLQSLIAFAPCCLRLPSQSELAHFQVQAQAFMYDYVTPENMMNALRWVKANNPLYADVEIHDDWLDQSFDDDTDLCASLLQQPDVEPMDTVS